MGPRPDNAKRAGTVQCRPASQSDRKWGVYWTTPITLPVWESTTTVWPLMFV